MIDLLKAIIEMITAMITRKERKDSKNDEFMPLAKDSPDDVTKFVRTKK